MKKKWNTVYLPEDMVVEILSRVPVLSLTRLRSTSKRWNALVKDERLAKKHSAYAPRQSPMVILLIDYKLYMMNISLHGIEKVDLSANITGQFSLKDPNSSEEVDIRDVFHYDGLLLCSTKDNRLVVWNPCLGEIRWIEPIDSYKESDQLTLGYDNRSSCYKILRLHRHEERIPLRSEYQVYDFKHKSWRVVGETGDWFIPSVVGRRRGFSVKGNTYWLAHNQDEPFDKFLLCFDFSADRFRKLSLPTGAPCCYYDVSSSVSREEQKLCVFSTHGSDSEVWIATKIDQSTGAILSWSKPYRFYLRIDEMTVLADHEKKVFVYHFEARSKNVFHIVGEDIYIILVNQSGAVSTRPFFLTYVPTLESSFL